MADCSRFLYADGEKGSRGPGEDGEPGNRASSMLSWASSSSSRGPPGVDVWDCADLVRAEMDDEMKANRDVPGDGLFFGFGVGVVCDRWLGAAFVGVAPGERGVVLLARLDLAVSTGDAGSQLLSIPRDPGDWAPLLSPVSGMSNARGPSWVENVGERLEVEGRRSEPD